MHATCVAIKRLARVFISVIALFTAGRVSQLIKKNWSVHWRCIRSRRKQVHGRCPRELIFRFILLRDWIGNQLEPRHRGKRRQAKRANFAFIRAWKGSCYREQRALSLLLCPVVYTPFLVRYIFMKCAPSKSRSCCSAILAAPSTQLISIAKAEAIHAWIYFNERGLAIVIIPCSRTSLLEPESYNQFIMLTYKYQVSQKRLV